MRMLPVVATGGRHCQTACVQPTTTPQCEEWHPFPPSLQANPARHGEREGVGVARRPRSALGPVSFYWTRILNRNVGSKEIKFAWKKSGMWKYRI